MLHGVVYSEGGDRNNERENEVANPQPKLYEVRDFYCAAYAIARGLDMEAYYLNTSTGFFNFQFPYQPMEQMMSEWYGPAPQVDVRKFIAAEKYIRGLMAAGRK